MNVLLSLWKPLSATWMTLVLAFGAPQSVDIPRGSIAYEFEAVRVSRQVPAPTLAELANDLFMQQVAREVSSYCRNLNDLPDPDTLAIHLGMHFSLVHGYSVTLAPAYKYRVDENGVIHTICCPGGDVLIHDPTTGNPVRVELDLILLD